ncbi:MAG: glycosyltransferase [Polyangiaceae bacterium]|nr:glycosyltransferase [Polyangiaceae bacterium]
MPEAVLIVVPCFNEARRLTPAAFAPLLVSPDLALLFVDDGSTDDTAMVVERLLAQAGTGQLHRLPKNRGKAEAVRAGLLFGLERGHRWVGYADADMATSADDVVRLAHTVKDGDVAAVIAARVQMLGSRVERRFTRHVVGRVFATVASLGLGVPVYDTQCGAKVFADDPALRCALARPFSNRWAFDVELLGRLLCPEDPAIEPVAPSRIRELPVQSWVDVPGSKLRPTSMVAAGLGLLRICADYRWRQDRTRGGHR